MTIRLESSDFIRMFPTVVWKFQLHEEVAAAINKTILYRLEEMRASAPERSPDVSWQSGYALHRLDEFSALVECIQVTTQEVLSFLKIGSKIFEITGCWANVHGRGASHGVHSHPNNFLSGVYYVQTQEGADTINFHDPLRADRDYSTPGHTTHRGQYGSGGGARKEWHAAPVSRVATPLCRSQ